MAHDHNGRVGPPRCEECNAPLNSDDRRLRSAPSLCLDCHLERNPFPRVRKRKGCLSRGLHASVSGPSPFRAGAVALISYTYSLAAVGSQLNITNQLMGFAPAIQVLLENVYNGNQFNVLLYSVVASKLSFATKQEDFIIPEFDFEAFANVAGQVIDMYSNE